jgi:hypothetical protein
MVRDSRKRDAGWANSSCIPLFSFYVYGLNKGYCSGGVSAVPQNGQWLQLLSTSCWQFGQDRAGIVAWACSATGAAGVGDTMAAAGFLDFVKAAINAATPSPSRNRNPTQKRPRKSPPNGKKPRIQRLRRIGMLPHGISFLGLRRPPPQ